MTLLAILFFLIALLYSMAGFGGSSAYNALLVLFGTDFRIYPIVALICNLIVVSGGCWFFLKRGHFSARLLLPFVVTSIPMAHLTGRISIDKDLFLSVLGISLLLAGVIMLFNRQLQKHIMTPESNHNLWLWGLPLGAGLGGLAGLVGIGGGIFLSPVLYLLGWGTAQQIAATASGFIFVNSLAGLSGQYFKVTESIGLNPVLEFWPAFIAVFVGGQIGSRLSSEHLPAEIIQRLTAALVLYVALRIGWYLLQA